VRSGKLAELNGVVMRRASTPAIPPNLYRHFAIVTVVIAAGLALFAEGDNREAQAAQVAPAPPARDPSPPGIAWAGPTTMADSSAGGWDEVDFDSSFGAPMDAPLGDSGAKPELDEDSASPPSGPATLSPSERDVLLRGLREQVASARGG
jgi:hypothetical protein